MYNPALIAAAAVAREKTSHRQMIMPDSFYANQGFTNEEVALMRRGWNENAILARRQELAADNGFGFLHDDIPVAGVRFARRPVAKQDPGADGTMAAVAFLVILPLVVVLLIVIAHL